MRVARGFAVCAGVLVYRQVCLGYSDPIKPEMDMDALPRSDLSLSLAHAHVRLDGGVHATLRPIRPVDADLLSEFHDGLSDQSRFFRFFSPKPRLTSQETHYLTNVDFESRFAIVATVEVEGGERIIAVGRFDVIEPGGAEAAIVVADDHQRQGLGAALLERLVRIARLCGVRSLGGEVLEDNHAMLALLRMQGVAPGPASGGVRQFAMRLSTQRDSAPWAEREAQVAPLVANG